MRKAKNIEDLLVIRQENMNYLESINSNLGTALGLKNADGDPCVIVFVPRKIDRKWLTGGTEILKKLETTSGLWCPLDVVEGGKYDSYFQPHFVDVADSLTPIFGSARTFTPADIIGPLPLSTPGRVELLESLRGWTEKISPGAQLFHEEGWYGTLACFAKDASGRVGLLTNKHVAGEIGNRLRFPEEEGIELAIVSQTFEYIADEIRFPGVIDLPENDYRVDCAFAPLSTATTIDHIETRIPVLNSKDNVEFKTLGEPLPLDISTMGPIGKTVVSVGRTRSFQRGTIGAVAYAWDDENFRSKRNYTDYLVIGEDGEQFSDYGDSGKLIVTEDGYRPVALLWGGWKEKLRKGRMQEDWTYAIDINKVLELLNVTILREVTATPTMTRSRQVRSRTTRRR